MERSCLLYYLVPHSSMKKKEAQGKFCQIVSAIQYCPQKYIIPRDLQVNADMQT
jgi:MAP/microtubule affinity-regulating kinase